MMEPMWAAGATEEALLRLRPPRDDGRDAFLHDHSGRGPPAMLNRLSLIYASNVSVASLTNSGGQVLRENEILGKDRQWRSSMYSS